MANHFEILASPLRIAILGILTEGPVSIPEIVERVSDIGSSQSVTAMLCKLRLSGKISVDRTGRRSQYSLTDDGRSLVKLIGAIAS